MAIKSFQKIQERKNQVLKLLNIRFIMTVCIVFVVLYSTVVYLLLDNTNLTIPKNLLSNKPSLVYGESVSNHDTIALRLDELGEAAILFNTNTFNADNFSQVQLSVEGLSNNYQVQFVWVSQSKNGPNEMPLIQPNGEIRTNLLSNNPDWRGEISQLGLRIIPQEHLGLAVTSNNIIKINSVILSGGNYFDNYAMLATYWLQYDSWNYRSINHLKMNSHLPIYAQPLIFILMWLVVCYVILLFIYKARRTSIVLFILIAWLFLDMLFLHNSRAKSIWVNALYQTEEKLLPDEDLNKLALQIKSLLGLNNDRTNKIKTHKVLILSSDRYQRARLIYHMLPVNSSFLDDSIETNAKARVEAGDYILSYDIANNPKKPVLGQLQINTSKIPVKEIASGNNFSIMKVIN